MADSTKQLRAWLERGGPTVIGGVGCADEALIRVLDRLDELEWIVAVMRGLQPLNTPDSLE